VLTLVHALSGIILLVLMSLILALQKAILPKANNNYPFNVIKNLFKIITVITLLYVLFSTAVIAYSQSISNLLTYFEIILNILFGKEAFTYAFYPSSMVRDYQEYLSAPAVAFVISSVIVTFIMHIFRKTNFGLSRLVLLSTSILAMFLIALAASGQILSLKPGVPMAVSRYFGSYGFGLAIIPTIYVLYKVNLSASKSKIIHLSFLLCLVVLVMNVLMDPMILPSELISTSPYDTIRARARLANGL
jgi:hypothetical protein